MEGNDEFLFHRVELEEWIVISLRKFNWLAASLSLESELSNSIQVAPVWCHPQANAYETVLGLLLNASTINREGSTGCTKLYGLRFLLVERIGVIKTFYQSLLTVVRISEQIQN